MTGLPAFARPERLERRASAGPPKPSAKADYLLPSGDVAH